MTEKKSEGAARGPAALPTPGPWVMRPGVCRNDHPDTSADVHSSGGHFVADCGCHEQATANAQLIAAAPLLSDALRALWCAGHSFGSYYEQVVAALQAAGVLASNASGGAAAPQGQISGAGSSGEKERGGG